MLEAQRSDEFRKIIAWLSAVDPWTNHASARQRHEEQTRGWLLQCSQYQEWKNGTIDHLWMHGKAGCGKTVLCSTVIEDIQECCRNCAGVAFACFYFSFSDHHKQTDEDLLRSLVEQLCRTEPAFSMLRQAYNSPEQRALVPEELAKILSASIRMHERVFLVMDALDECPEDHEKRQRVLERVERIIQSAPNVKIFATSRNLVDICMTLESLNFELLHIATSFVDADIRKYVSSQLSRDRHFHKLRSETIGLIENTITARADGM
jgi:hypothetical protein